MVTTHLPVTGEENISPNRNQREFEEKISMAAANWQWYLATEKINKLQSCEELCRYTSKPESNSHGINTDNKQPKNVTGITRLVYESLNSELSVLLIK